MSAWTAQNGGGFCGRILAIPTTSRSEALILTGPNLVASRHDCRLDDADPEAMYSCGGLANQRLFN